MDPLTEFHEQLDPRVRYHRWYRAILEKLFSDRDAGYAILMITFPLLERFVFGLTRRSTADHFSSHEKKEILAIFKDELRTINNVGDFWSACRHGLLHQVTPFISKKNGDPFPNVVLTHDIPVPICIEDDGSIIVHPVLFARRILDSIEADFSTFRGGKEAHINPLPKVEVRNTLLKSPMFPDYPDAYEGTSLTRRKLFDE